jgi:pyrroline-5-carboxylate reductase
MLAHTRLAFLGSGVMAEAMLSGLLNQELLQPDQVVASDPLARRRAELYERYGVEGTADNAEAIEGADVVVLAVKPQVLGQVLADLSGHLVPSQLVISIVAGATLDTIAWGLDHREVVRVMPNTPARIGEGMSVWTATPEVCDSDLERTRCILQALGKEIYVTNEDELDMATALSGTGPAYVFLFMEALVDAGVHLGFSRRVAQELVLQTVRGSVDFASQSRGHLADLRNQVTSPGGTSAEALYQMEKGALRTIVSKAVHAAYQRSRALSRLSEPPTVG